MAVSTVVVTEIVVSRILSGQRCASAAVYSWIPWLSFLHRLLQPGLKLTWLQALGPQGPWLVDRLIGARDMPAAMDTDGKAAEVRDCVRRAVFHVPGDNSVKSAFAPVHGPVMERTAGLGSWRPLSISQT